MKYERIIAFLLLCSSLSLFSQKKKVLLIGIDGLQFEQIAKAETPNFDKFTIKKGYTGGVFGTEKQQVTSSGPSWMTILTGVWANQHKVISNSSEQISEAKSIFNFIRSNKPKLYTSSIATWKNINLLLYKEMYGVNFSSQGGSDAHSANLAVDQIKTKAPDFIFIHLDDIDHAGHSKGFGKEYTASILKIDKSIGRLLKATKNREREHNEDWLIILVTDHGRGKGGYGHGNHSIQEKTIFIGMNKKGTAFFEGIDNDRKVTSIKELEKLIPQTAVVPTILKYLDIPVQKEWRLDTVSLLD